jgi:subtilisin-like proprotein convertase family protein
VGDNSSGVSGIAYKCKILPVKIFLGDSLVSTNTLADAIRYAGQKADVLSNSWSMSYSSDVEYAIKDVTRTGRNGKGTPVFVATGNDSNPSIGFPANVDEAIAVGASTNKGRRSSYSNYGNGIDFLAPSSGGSKKIFTTDVSINDRGFNVGDINSGGADGLYTNSFGGTSSATPLAAGVAALILSLNPDLKWDQVRSYMRDTAEKIDREQGDYANEYSLEYGYGRINAFKALELVKDDMNGGGQGAGIYPVIEENNSPALSIPDHDLVGITDTIEINEDGTIELIEEVSVNISHPYRGDLLVSLVTPDNEVISLHEGQGSSSKDLIKNYNTGNINALQQLTGKGVRGKWSLKVVDRYPDDKGTLNSWSIRARLKRDLIRGSASPGLHIPDDDTQGVVSSINIPVQGKVKDIKVGVDISHSYIGDLTVKISSPSNKEVFLHRKTGGTTNNLKEEYNLASHQQLDKLLGEAISGDWTLSVTDTWSDDTGKLNYWDIEFKV